MILVNVGQFERGPACAELPENQLFYRENVWSLWVQCEIGVYTSLCPLILTENGEFLFFRPLC